MAVWEALRTRPCTGRRYHSGCRREDRQAEEPSRRAETAEHRASSAAPETKRTPRVGVKAKDGLRLVSLATLSRFSFDCGSTPARCRCRARGAARSEEHT